MQPALISLNQSAGRSSKNKSQTPLEPSTINIIFKQETLIAKQTENGGVLVKDSKTKKRKKSIQKKDAPDFSLAGIKFGQENKPINKASAVLSDEI